jgi:hypothetical protein
VTGIPKELAKAYIDAAGKSQYDQLPQLLQPELEFRGPYVTLHSADDYIAALRRIGAVRLRHDVRKIFVDGDEVCVIYDFVTNTAAGAVPMIEWLTFECERLRSIRLYFDREQFAPAREALARLASVKPA